MNRFIEVLIPNIPLRKSFNYAIRPNQNVDVGGVVLVNFSNRVLHAIVINTNVVPDKDIIRKIKPIKEVVCHTYFSKELFKTLQILSDYYVYPLADVLFTALPPYLRGNKIKLTNQLVYRYFIAPEIDKLLNKFICNLKTESLNNDKLDFFGYVINNFLNIDKNQIVLDPETINSTLKEEVESSFAQVKEELDLLNITKNRWTVLYKIKKYQLLTNYILNFLEKQGTVIEITNKKSILKNSLKTNSFSSILEKDFLNFTNSNIKIVDNANLVKEWIDNKVEVYYTNQAFIDETQNIFNILPVISKKSKSFDFLLSNGLINSYPVLLQSSRNSYDFSIDLDTDKSPNLLSTDSLVNRDDRYVLNQEQKTAYEKIVNSFGYNAFLLDGVTGSGKTEVYLQVIEHYLLLGKSCLVLVPEIGLTPQTVSRFSNRFNVPISIVHSNISDEEKNKVYERAQKGKVSIIIGTRSSIFAPLKNLGIIIIDEEHDSSYKQDNDFRYHAREVALLRASILGINIVVGTATPSFTTLYNLEVGKYQHLILTKRAVAKYKLETALLDIRNQDFLGIDDKKTLLNKAGITYRLWDLIKKELNKNNQVLLFLNRRGYAPILHCEECGYIYSCSQCDNPFSYHKAKHRLHCHICFIESSVPDSCLNCGSFNIKPLGVGTERIDETLCNLYNPNKVIRIDRDTSFNKASLERNLAKMHATEGAILVGTQMIAKGHHFPDITLVALLNIDALVFGDDYRSSERLAQLYLQVAGRAGREEKQGSVVIQTSYPNEQIFHDLLTLSYFQYAQKYLQVRRNFNLPPYTYQAYIAIRHIDKRISLAAISLLKDFLDTRVSHYVSINKAKGESFFYNTSIHVLGKQNNLYKYVVDFVCSNRQVRSLILKELYKAKEDFVLFKKYNIYFYIDVDPLDLL